MSQDMSRASFYSGQSIKEKIREDVNFYSGQSIKEKIQVNKDALTSCLNVQGLRPHLTGMGVVDQRMMDSIVQFNSGNREQVSELLDYLLGSPAWKLDAFLQACDGSGQGHVRAYLK